MHKPATPRHVSLVGVVLLLISLLLPLLVACGSKATEDFTINVYTRSDAAGAADMWAAYLGNHKQDDLKGTAVYGDPGLDEAVKKDMLGIGYSNIGYAYDLATGKALAGLKVVPIDLNNNGKLDAEENFYNTLADIDNAIATGKYPSPPARDLYLVTKGKFTGVTKEFVRWILTDGQQYVSEAGYVAVSPDKLNGGLSKLGDKDPGVKMEGSIMVSGAFALYPMVVKWSEEFQKLYPKVSIDISAGGAGKGMADALGGMVDLGMISREINPAEAAQGAVWVPVARDGVVPIINENNPLLKEIMAKGIRQPTFIDIWITGNITDWRDAVK
jgi:ABC-type phosphate transport system substrate-binding protein